MALNVAIIGGGIGGLASAIALKQAGCLVRVYEQAPEILPLGASISLWPNALHCLDEWGLADDIRRQAGLLDRVALRRIDGSSYIEFDLAALHEKYGHQSICVPRSVIQDIMLSALDREDVVLNAKLEKLTQEPHTVTLHFADGQEAQADFVIGADGIWSRTREIVLGDRKPNYAGYGAWLGIANSKDLPDIPNEIAEFYGSNGRFGLAPCGESKRYWFFVENSKRPRQMAGQIERLDLINLLSDWPDWYSDYVRNTENTVYAPFFERSASKVWGKDRVVLVGDAMHPFTPNLGQGACQAIEDAHVLSQILPVTQPSDVIQKFSQIRSNRVAMFIKEARQIGQLAQYTKAPMRWLRDLAFNLSGSKRLEQSFDRHFDRGSHS